MSFVKYLAEEQLFHLARLANPTFPSKFSSETLYIPRVVHDVNHSVALFVGRYGAGVKGQTQVTYQRLDLAKLFLGGPLRINTDTIGSIHSMLDSLYFSTGFAFDVTDLEDQTPPVNQTLPWRVTLKATPGSFLYYGEVEVEFVYAAPKLFNLVLQTQLTPTLASITPTASRQRAELYTFGIDYTSVQERLKALPVGSLSWSVAGSQAQLNCTELADALNDIDRLPWKSQVAAVDFNLQGATIVYNGKTKDYVPTAGDLRIPNTRFDRVLVVSFVSDTTGSTGFYGSSMFIHYNLDTDNEVPNGNS